MANAPVAAEHDRAPPLLVAEDVGKQWGSGAQAIPVLQGIDLVVGAGEFVSMIGLSGCGKSTLLDVVAGLVQPTSGRVLIDGALIDGPHPDIGFVFQQDATLPWLTRCATSSSGFRTAR